MARYVNMVRALYGSNRILNQYTTRSWRPHQGRQNLGTANGEQTQWETVPIMDLMWRLSFLQNSLQSTAVSLDELCKAVVTRLC